MKIINRLEIKNLYKKFGEKIAVKNLKLSILPGEIFALIGPNGAGKTTTVKMITGLIQQDSGDVLLDGDNLLENTEIKKDIGYIPDEPFVYPYLTGMEFLQFTADIYGIERVEMEKKIKPYLEQFQIEDIINDLIDDYSRGNKQKISIICAMMHNPRLLIVDEPIVGLDVEAQAIVRQVFREYAKNGGSILLCTHVMPVAENLADKIAIIKNGKIIKQGNISELRKSIKSSKANLETIYIKTLE